MRGSLPCELPTARPGGIIPAGAGLTRRCRPDWLACGDHPRGCGAHVFVSCSFAPRRGSSPRVRGSLPRSDSQTRQEGIIPAGAGLTRGRLVQDSRWWDHPRGCGAHSPPHFFTVTIRGSSPRVRGSRVPELVTDDVGGIIPAGAGLTRRMFPALCMRRDHPRGCGAHFPAPRQGCHISGSSPRVRGSHNRRTTRSSGHGIIPAGAGLTTSSTSASAAPRDHPRGCGAHPQTTCERWDLQGSSPRVRGSRIDNAHAEARRGIIPAGAGLTHEHDSERGRAWDHPRGCGAHSSKRQSSPLLMGSSPRVRGSRDIGKALS